jgi:hypothetical protein
MHPQPDGYISKHEGKPEHCKTYLVGRLFARRLQLRGYQDSCHFDVFSATAGTFKVLSSSITPAVKYIYSFPLPFGRHYSNLAVPAMFIRTCYPQHFFK